MAKEKTAEQVRVEKKLQELIRKTTKRGSILAEKLDIDNSNLNQWKYRGIIPIKHKAALEEMYNINPNWWEDTTDEESIFWEVEDVPSTPISSPWESYAKTLQSDLDTLKAQLEKKDIKLSELEQNKLFFDSSLYKIKFILTQLKQSKSTTNTGSENSILDNLITELEKMVKEYEGILK